MSNARPIVHMVGSIPLPDAESVFRTVSGAVGPYLKRLPDGETGIRQMWIRFLQKAMADHPAIEPANVPAFKFTQWDGKVLREIPRLRVKPGATVDAAGFKSGYADMAMESWGLFQKMQQAGVIPGGVKFQVCLPTPIAPLYNNAVPSDRPKILPALTEHFKGEVAKIAKAIPNDRVSIQWDVCQEVLAWEGVYDTGPVDFRSECLETLEAVGDAVPASIDFGYHLCYGSPADEHIVQPKDAALMVDMVNAVAERVKRKIDFFHLPVPKQRTDEAFYVPFNNLKIKPETDLYLGLIHHNDEAGNATRLALARRHTRVDGVATECGMGRGDPTRLPALLAAHAKVVAA